jgi:hypothetical protein
MESGQRELLSTSVRYDIRRTTRRTALPSSDEPSAQQLTCFRRSQTGYRKWVVPEEVVEFQNSLGQEAEDKETAVDGQWSPVLYRIAFMAHDDNTCWYWQGSGVWIFVEPYDCGVRYTIQETKAR